MKKIGKIMSMFLLLTTIVTSVFVTNDNKVSARYSPQEEDIIVYRDTNNSITITKDGGIVIAYTYGYTELFVVATACSSYAYPPSTAEEDRIKKNATACNYFKGKTQLIHLSGDYNRNRRDDENVMTRDSKTIHLFDYFDYYDMVQVKLIFDFTSEVYSGNSGQYTPLFCNVDSGMSDCSRPDGVKKHEMTAQYRVEQFYNNNKNQFPGGYEIQHKDRKQLIYKNNAANREEVINKGYSDLNQLGDGENDTVYISVSNSKIGGSAGEIEELIFNTMIPTLLVILSLAAFLTISILGYKIIKSADEPQERQAKIKALRNILIGIGIVMLLLFITEPATEFIKGYLE